MPTSTGAARATTRAVPELAGRFDGIAVRAPIPVGSVADIVFDASRPTTIEEVNEAFRQEAATARYEGILGVSEDPLVSADIVGDPRAAVIDLELTTGRGRHAGQGDGLVRQRVGLHPPDDPRGPQHPCGAADVSTDGRVAFVLAGGASLGAVEVGMLARAL